MCSNIGTPNNHHFPFGTNGKVVVSGVPIFKHFRVCSVGISIYTEMEWGIIIVGAFIRTIMIFLYLY